PSPTFPSKHRTSIWWRLQVSTCPSGCSRYVFERVGSCGRTLAADQLLFRNAAGEAARDEAPRRSRIERGRVRHLWGWRGLFRRFQDVDALRVAEAKVHVGGRGRNRQREAAVNLVTSKPSRARQGDVSPRLDSLAFGGVRDVIARTADTGC